MFKSKLTGLLLVCFFVITAMMPVHADDLDNTKKQLNDVNRVLNQQQQQLNQTQKVERGIIGQIENLEKNIKTTENSLEETKSKINNLQVKIDVAKKEIEEREKNLLVKTQLLSDRLVYIFEDGDVSYLEVLLSSTDFNDFLTRYELLNAIVSNDMDLIESIKKEQSNLKMIQSELEVNAQELENNRIGQKNMKEELDLRKAEKEKMLSSVQKEKEKYQEAIDELERTSRDLEQMIRKAQGNSSGGKQGTGSLTWPTPGYSTITSPYGMRFHPILKERRMHTGVDIGAPNSAKIVAADDGVVISSGWMGGYGQTIIIDHGKGISTLYAHQSVLIAKEGESVTKGEMIGKVGSTGWSTGPHLHFEVRINGNPTDPMAYL